jgi:hypothetical protein
MLATDVLCAWERAGIAYCVWKGSMHLRESFEGASDLDLLVDPSRLSDAEKILASFGCRPGRTAPARAEVAVQDYLGIEVGSRRIVHFHVYSRLVVGEPHLDRFRLPWERWILDTRHRAGDVSVADPAVEATLLLIRAALRLGVGGISTWLGIANTRLRAELGWLLSQTDEDRVLRTADRWLGASGRSAVARCLKEGPTIGALARLRTVVRRGLASQSSVRGLRATTRRWLRTLAWTRRGVYRRFLERPVLLARGASGGGLLVAVIGADGSGKSTLAKDLREWFAPKFDAMYVYMGSGDGPASPLRWPMKVVHRRLTGKEGGSERKEALERRHPGWLGVAKAAWALALSREKAHKLRRAMVARRRGLVVFSDRYPQIQFSGQNDGPLLSAWRTSSSRGRRYLARLEQRPYELAARFAPDLVIRLRVDLETAMARRPQLAPEYLVRRIDLINELHFDGGLFGVVEIDAAQPYDRVFADAAQAIWSRM